MLSKKKNVRSRPFYFTFNCIQYCLCNDRKKTLIRLIVFFLLILILVVWKIFDKSVSSFPDRIASDSKNFDDMIVNRPRYQKVENWTPRNPPIIDFFIRTWHGDGHWLVFLLRSIEKYVPSNIYRNIIITYSSREAAYFESYLPFFSLPIKLIATKDVFIRDGPNKGGYYTQMYAKMHAYEHSDADFFIHMDSDTIFKERITRQDFLDDQNRVYVMRSRFDTMKGDLLVWRKPAEQLFKESVPYETMTGFPFVFPRDLYPNTIHLIETRHNKSFVEAARSVEGFIEFTTLGHYLITHAPKNSWIDNQNKSNKVVQSWSWGKFGPNQVAFYECLLRANHANLCKLQT